MRAPVFRRQLLKKVTHRKAGITVFGLGAVGLQVALAFSRAGFNSIGVDTDSEKVNALSAGLAPGHEEKTARLMAKFFRKRRFQATSDLTLSASCSDFVVLCLPTPLTSDNLPDLRFLVDTCAKLSSQDLRNKCIILESSVYPGVTRKILKPALELGRYVAGVDFGLAHSPERVDTNNRDFPLARIPKLVGGIDKASTDVACALYAVVLKAPVIRVASAEIAEAAKMLENTYRFVNICMMNEVASAFESMGVDTFDVVKAASTKPFGFMPHYPGPGVGGHCIPKDPFYLMKAAKEVGKSLTIVEAAVHVNKRIPIEIVARIDGALGIVGKSINGARVALLGLAYKRNVDDTRRSSAFAILSELQKHGAVVRVYDPVALVRKSELHGIEQCRSLEQAIRDADVIFLHTDHDIFHKLNLAKIRGSLARDPILFDARNFWDTPKAERKGYLYRGIGKRAADDNSELLAAKPRSSAASSEQRNTVRDSSNA